MIGEQRLRLGGWYHHVMAWPVVCLILHDLTHKGFVDHPNFLSVRQARARLAKWIAHHVHALLFWEDSVTTNSTTARCWYRSSSMARRRLVECQVCLVSNESNCCQLLDGNGNMAIQFLNKKIVYKGQSANHQGYGKTPTSLGTKTLAALFDLNAARHVQVCYLGGAW